MEWNAAPKRISVKVVVAECRLDKGVKRLSNDGRQRQSGDEDEKRSADGMTALNGFVHGKRVASPNDPKLSDRRSGRGTCRRVERWRWSAAGAVTAEPVRCSAWFGDVGCWFMREGAKTKRKGRSL